MNGANEILQELESISPLLAQIPKVNVFRVPENYFGELAEKLALFIFINKNQPYSESIEARIHSPLKVPEGYFETLSDRILAKIKNSETQNEEDELKHDFPILHSLKGKNVFIVPQNYFQNLSSEILKKISNKPTAKIISISTKWWKYAAAAGVTGIIAFSSFFLFNNPQNGLQNNTAVKTSTAIPDYVQSSFKYKTPEQLDEGIASLSDDEIIKYLEKHGSILDNDQLTKDVDVKELPSADDYLIDDNTLNNYLQKIDSKNNNQNTP